MSKQEARQNPAVWPSTNWDFSFCVLVRDLILDLVCVPWVAASHGAERRRVPAPFNHPPTGLHLHVEAPFHAAHLHVLMQVAVHVALCCRQFHLKNKQIIKRSQLDNSYQFLPAVLKSPPSVQLLGKYKTVDLQARFTMIMHKKVKLKLNMCAEFILCKPWMFLRFNAACWFVESTVGES